MDEEQFEKLISKINILIKLNASNIIQGKKLKEQVVYLNSIGLSLKEVASIVDKKPTDIDQYLYRKKIPIKKRKVKK